MKVLLVDIDPSRIKWFKEQLIGHSLDISKVASLADFLVLEKKYDLIFLDHDLGGRENVDSNDENTGYQTAKSIRRSINSDTKIIVHSCNPVGACNIQSILRHAHIIPFIKLNKLTLIDFIKEIKGESKNWCKRGVGKCR